ncbi:MAG: HlyC/CorC family transporter [Alphaproteobacteria bacterium]
MTLTIGLTVLTILVLIVFSAFFSGSETALTAASRARLHQLEQQGDKRARRAGQLITRRERLIGAILLGNNTVNILASALATSLLITLFGESGVAYATIAMTLLVLIFAEVLPKTYAIRHADRMALSVAPAIALLVRVLAPITQAIDILVKAILYLLGDRGGARTQLSVTDEIRGVIDLHAREGTMRKHYRDMLRSVLDLSEVEVGEIMVHRNSMATIDADIPAPDIVSEVLSSPFTRIPIWRGNPDNIVGVLHAKSVLQAVAAHQGTPEQLDVAAAATPPWFVPDTTTLGDQLTAFRARREHVALVVDEYGALMGLVTLEDILEEIVGEISDEFDKPTTGVYPQPDGSILVNGGVTIRDLNRTFDWRLPDEEATTVAGLVIHEAQLIPEIGQTFEFHGFGFEVAGREGNRITALKMHRLETPPETD